MSRWEYGYLKSESAPLGSGELASVVMAACAAAVALVVLNVVSDTARLAVFTIIVTVFFTYAVVYVTRNPSWLIFALIFEEVIPYLNVLPLDPKSRWFLRYPLLLPLCLPALWVALRSGLLWRGGFKTLAIFFVWAVATIAYSLTPEISAGRLLPDFLLFAALSVATLSVSNAEDVQKILSHFLLGCGILQLGLVLSYLLPGSLTWIPDEGLLRFAGIFTTPNAVGALMLATVGAGVVLWRATAGWRRTVLAATMLSSVTFAIVADSRSETLVAMIGVMAYAVSRRGLKAAAICAVLGVAALFALEVMNSSTLAYLNRDVGTLTGRTEAWQFEIAKLGQRPLQGYGYEVEGEIFQDRHFTNWQTFWDLGPNTSLHNGYMGLAIGMGLPALFYWLFVFLKPWFSLLASEHDDWNLKPLFFLVVLPMLILGFDESGLGEPRDIRGLLFFLSWALAERYRLSRIAINDRQGIADQSWSGGAFAALTGSLMCIAILIGSSATPASATTYYVDSQHGMDRASGSLPTAAWRTLSKIDHFQFRSGDIVRLARGATWRETLEPDGPGDANFAGVTFMTYGSGTPPTINGADAITTWSSWRGPIYQTREPRQVYNVFVDEAPGWGLRRACCLPLSPCPARDANSNCLIAQMMPGSWYWSGLSTPSALQNTLYVWLGDNTSPTSHLMEAVTRQYGIFGYGPAGELNNIRIDGLRIIETGRRGITLQSGEAAGCCDSRGTGGGTGTAGLIIRDTTILRTGTGRLDDGSYGNALSVINAASPVIEHNFVSYCGNHGNCIQVQNANGARVLNNDVDHWNHNGVDIKGSRNVLVEGNIGHDKPDDGAAFYAEYSTGVIFRNNAAHNVSNGFQISVAASASILDNSITDATTVLYFGPRANFVIVQANTANGCLAAVGTDGRGTLQQDDNTWRCGRP
jgi:O-antigen ligase